MTAMANLELFEICHELPENVPSRYLNDGVFLFSAFGCALMECETKRSYVYKAVNLENGRSEVLLRRKTPLTTSGVPEITERIRKSSVAGNGMLDVDRPFGKRLSLEAVKDILHTLFYVILPRYGYAIREKQVELAAHMLDAISKRYVTLAEAEVGTGKTHAYLAAAILAKRGRMNDFWNMGYYPNMQYVDMAHMPVVISTSSIALQNAIIRDYIPQLSSIMLLNGLIKTPLTAVIRKGKEHYICEYKLRSSIKSESNTRIKKMLESLLLPSAAIDLSDADGLTPYMKRKINVPVRCDASCPYCERCRYLQFMERAQSPEIDFQIVNHNYLLADTLRRADGKRPLIPNYQMIIVDEAHKFLGAARQMYGTELSSFAVDEILEDIYDLRFRYKDSERLVRKTAKKMSGVYFRLFNSLSSQMTLSENEDDADRYTVEIDDELESLLQKVHSMADELGCFLKDAEISGKNEGLHERVLWGLKQLKEQTMAFIKREELIIWLKKLENNTEAGALSETWLCAIPKNLDARLYKDLWSKNIPIILTSGTLSAGWALPSTPAYLRGRGGDFSHIKRTLGIDRVEIRHSETSKPSPFDYKKNALLYISNTMPYPDYNSGGYMEALTDEITGLINASHGHAAVLFTSYRVMDKVWETLRGRGLPFPLFRLDKKSGMNAIDAFKESGNGVLFASGAMWEGIDIPGDALSLLIIVKLPFAVPDPVGEYEKTLYVDMRDYKEHAVVPDMLIKLKQGFGRLIRTEKDTGAVAILDSRVNERGAYRKRVLEALPDCRVTSNIISVEQFFKAKKTPEYFG